MRLFDSVVATLGLSQPFQRFVREVLMLLVIVPGRATFLNLSRYSRYDEKTFRRGFRREVHCDLAIFLWTPGSLSGLPILEIPG